MTDSRETTALVLSGGAAAGNAWQIGVIAGLAEAGLDLTQRADLVIGTSAGATTATMVLSGILAADLYAAALEGPPQRPSGPGPGPRPALPIPVETVFERWRSIGAAATSAEEMQRELCAFGLESDPLLESGAAARRALVASRLPISDWPTRRMLITTVDAHTGELIALDRESGADLADAVTASTAMPGMVASVPINGARYFDGGVRSADNADLAAGYDLVVVLAPLATRPGETPPAAAFEGLRREPAWGTDLASQVETLRRQGSRVEVITPDDAAQAPWRRDMMNLANRAPAARDGHAQGLRGLRGLRRT